MYFCQGVAITFSPVGHAGMARHKLYLVNKDLSGRLVSGICAGCGRTFQFEDTPEGRGLEKAFETHECKCEAPTQTPDRIDPTHDH